MKATRLSWNGIIAVLLAASFGVCTYAQEKAMSKPLYEGGGLLQARHANSGCC